MIKKRLLSLTLGVVMLTTVFTGCNKSTSNTVAPADNNSEVKGEITFFNHRTDMNSDSYAKNWKTYIAEFNKKYPKVKINVETAKDYEGEVAIRMNSNNFGDVLMMPSKMKDKDLPSYFISLGKKSEIEKKYEFVQDRYIGDDIYGMPTAGTCSGVLYNKKVFTDAGVTTIPKTEEEFLIAMKKIKDKGDAVPVYTNYKDKWPLGAWEAYVMSVAGDETYRNQKLLHLDDPFSQGKPHYIVGKYLFDIVQQKLCEKDPLTTNWENSKQMIADGKIGCMFLGSWAIGQMKALAKNPDDIAYMPFPYTVNGKLISEAAGDYKICINKNSKNIEASKAWLWWFIDESEFIKNEGLVPVKKGAEYPAVLKAFQDLGVQLKIDPGSKPSENGYLDAIDKESEIGLWSENFRKDIVDTALGNKKGTYDDIMNGLNKKWASTRKKLLDEGKIKD